MKIHIVQKGDTLWEIANKYEVDFEKLKQLNSQLSSPDMIMPGMKIKIPSSTKPVKKEDLIQKETKKPLDMGMSPKPIPIIKEDDMEEPKEVKVEMPKMPMKPMAEMPMKPPMETPMKPMMEMPVLDKETQIKFPEVPSYSKPKEGPPKKEETNQKHHQPMVMVPVCCHYIHPCFQPMHHHHPAMGNMAGGYMNSNQMMNHSMEMPMKPMQMGQTGDCGCQPHAAFPHHHMEHPMTAFPYERAQQNYQQPKFTQQQMHPNPSPEASKYPPNFANNQAENPFPSPPGYSPFTSFNNFNNREKGNESSSE